MINQAIAKLANGDNLGEKIMTAVMEILLDGAAEPAQIGAFITALRMKGETVEEITGAAKAMRAKTKPIELGGPVVNIDRDEINVEEETIMDTHGNGANSTRTFNISTATALVVAAAGLQVAKYGNQALSKQCGSADVLLSLGVNLDINLADVEKCIQDIGIGFLYAPLFHGAMKAVAAPRQQVGLRSIFNILGPLANPAGATAQVLGVYDAGQTEKMARVLQKLGTRRAFVVCGDITLDEISICGATRVSHLKDGTIDTFEMTPETHGFKRAAPEAIKGGDASENAAIIRRILAGQKGPQRDVVLLNAAAAFVSAGLDADFKDGIQRAGQALDSGRAAEKLDRLVHFTRQCNVFLRRVM
ncbi:MAG: anthranilate phosphoribosyltransferase [Deltaproteobacteria bacterium]|jgi:anthranilate phosphoribosyltransferase|nr:anthranilate phosphoribosyltransferase [Deltaproteobacteria bacterium]